MTAFSATAPQTHARAPNAPLSMAVLGVSTLEAARAFFVDIVGMAMSAPETLDGEGFAAHWRLPRESRARAAMFSVQGHAVGRVLALEFDAPARKKIVQPGDRTYRGLWNLNFYVEDIRAVAADLKARGFSLWSEPLGWTVSESAGAPIEVLFDGPDGVCINLVQLTGGPDTVIGRLKAEIASQPHTKNGWTPIVTTSHSLIDYDKARAFYERVCGMRSILDTLSENPTMNTFTGRPHDAATQISFMAAPASPLGKIALSFPRNYTVPNRVPDAVAPNIGYLAQSFLMPDLDAALETGAALGVEPFSSPVAVPFPVLGAKRAALVRNPGSGALMQLVEDR
jgi:catechol 2,3-dioxygenase-like lactoylglutathione lyase family enzyme